MKQLSAIIWAVLVGILLSATVAHAATDRIRVLLLDGESGGPYHNWELTTPILKKELEETGLFDVTVATAPHADGDFSNFKPEFSSYQVVVSNLDSADWPSELRSRVRAICPERRRLRRRPRGGQCLSQLARL